KKRKRKTQDAKNACPQAKMTMQGGQGNFVQQNSKYRENLYKLNHIVQPWDILNGLQLRRQATLADRHRQIGSLASRRRRRGGGRRGACLHLVELVVAAIA